MEGQIAMAEERIIHTTGWNNCGGRCLIDVHMKDGQIAKLTTRHCSAEEGGVPLTACPRGLNYHTTFLGEDRLRYPMRRAGRRGEGRFERISWKEAVDTIVSEWKRIRDTYGVGSRYVNYATGVEGVAAGNSFARRLLALDGGFLGYYNSYSSACISQATKLMYGTGQTGSPLTEWLNAKLILLWGHNPMETHFDSETMYYLREAKKKGIPIIAVDPRKNDTILALDAEWIPLRPATDAALTDAMAYVLVREGLCDMDFLDRCCLGFDKAHMPEGIDPSECYLSYLTGEKDGIPKTPQWAEKITGVPAAKIEELAVRFGTAKPAALIQGYGAQRHAYGEQGTRGGITLACMTGNVGIPGGWASGNANCSVNPYPMIPRPENPYPMTIPCYTWTQAVLDGRHMTDLDGVRGGDHLDSDIKMILNLAGNCLINQHGDINRTAEILRDETKCEFIVCSDVFMTASARFADILLPGVSMFETENITMPWKYGDFVGYTNKVIEPLYESRPDYEWLCEVAEGLGLKEAFTEGLDTQGWLRRVYASLRETDQSLPAFEDFQRAGIAYYHERKREIAFVRQREDPERYPFPTESGKIEIFSPEVWRGKYRDFFPVIPRYVEPPEGPNDPLRVKYPLQLIGWHTKRRCHTVHDNNERLKKLDPQRLWIHPDDAAERGIAEGVTVRVFNDRGALTVPAHLTDRIMRGVCALAQGAWYRPDRDGTDRGGSINVLTSLRPTPYARGNGQHTNLVEVSLEKEEG